MRWPAIALVAATACGGESGPTVRPIVEAPSSGSDGYPWDGLTDLVLSIAFAGAADDIESASAAPGETLALNDVDFAAGLVLHLSGREGSLEVAYGRSCVFAADEDAALPDPRIYFARVVKWAAGPAPAEPMRRGGHAYSTVDGRAVFVGGEQASGVERFDPDRGAFEVVALDPPIIERSRAVLVALPDGRALRVGGINDAGDAVPAIEVLDPRPTAGVPLDQRQGPRVVDHAAAALVDGDVLVVGGRGQPDDGAAFEVTAAAFLIEFGAGGGVEEPRLLEAEPALPRAGHTLTRLGDEVGADLLLIGGQAADGSPIGLTELFRPLRGAFELVDGAVLLTPRWGHTAIRLPGGFVLVIGGLTDDGLGDSPRLVDTIELYDPVQGRFTLAGQMPPRAGLTEMTVTPLPDGRVLLAGGRDADGLPVDTALIAAFDPLSGEVIVSPTDRMGAPRAGHVATGLCDGTILVVGGADEPEAPGAERYNPPAAGRRGQTP